VESVGLRWLAAALVHVLHSECACGTAGIGRPICSILMSATEGLPMFSTATALQSPTSDTQVATHGVAFGSAACDFFSSGSGSRQRMVRRHPQLTRVLVDQQLSIVSLPPNMSGDRAIIHMLACSCAAGVFAKVEGVEVWPCVDRADDARDDADAVRLPTTNTCERSEVGKRE
jgi:hypothetical protein